MIAIVTKSPRSPHAAPTCRLQVVEEGDDDARPGCDLLSALLCSASFAAWLQAAKSLGVVAAAESSDS